MSTHASTEFNTANFTRAIEERDSDTQVAMYREDAQVTLVDRAAQPAAPKVLQGKSEIRAQIEEVCARDMSHRVLNTVSDENGAAFTEACRYPDGMNVLSATVLELQQGQIKSQTIVQAWDEPISQ